eukprot:3297702-Pleurochrysis_carterae.AAC.1
MDAPPSLPPSPPPMRPEEALERSGGDGPSQSPEGRGLEDRDKADSGPESDQTKATDNDPVDVTQESHGSTVTQGQLSPPSPRPSTDYGWNVRLCQVPEIGLPLPETRDLSVPVMRDRRFERDTIFLTFAAQFLQGGEFIEDYAANADSYWSPPPTAYRSTRVMWIELWKGDLRGMIPVRMLANTRAQAPEANTFGLRLTGDTYR